MMPAKRSIDWLLGARSETGYVRSANEDRMAWAPAPFGQVFVLADGMGGYRGGAEAAEIAVQTLKDRLCAIPPDSDRFGDYIRQAFSDANRAVHSRRNPEDPQTREMGATGLALVTRGPRAMVAHAGDSRAYLWQRETGLRRLTADHTLVQSMITAGVLTTAEAATHPDASVLERAIGHQPTLQADVSDWIDLQPGDTLLLCSDGLCGYVADDQIASVINADEDPQAITERLVECALATGGHDNVTVQLARYEPEKAVWKKGSLVRPVLMLPVAALLAGGAVYLFAHRKVDTLQDQVAQMQAQANQDKQTIDRLRSGAAASGTAASASAIGAGPGGAAPAASIPAPASQASAPQAAASPPVSSSKPGGAEAGRKGGVAARADKNTVKAAVKNNANTRDSKKNDEENKAASAAASASKPSDTASSSAGSASAASAAHTGSSSPSSTESQVGVEDR